MDDKQLVKFGSSKTKLLHNFSHNDKLVKEVKYYDFDLDLPRSIRWKHIFDANNDKLEQLKAHANKILMPYLNILSYLELGFNLIDKDNIKFSEELEYIAKRMDMKFFHVILLQLVYEAHSACTSAVFTIGSETYLYRTMDWEMPFLKDITIGLQIKRNGEYISHVVTWLGCVGFFTASSITNKYSVAINYRRTQEMDVTTSLTNGIRCVAGIYPICYLVREIINSQNLSDAIKTFKDTELISPCYIILYNQIQTNESVVITRDYDKAINVRYTNLIQTNCDYNKLVPNILFSLQRRALFEQLIKDLNNRNGEKLSYEKILRALSVFPILNEETIYVHFEHKYKYVTFI